jgi:hypothetical protein
MISDLPISPVGHPFLFRKHGIVDSERRVRGHCLTDDPPPGREWPISNVVERWTWLTPRVCRPDLHGCF